MSLTSARLTTIHESATISVVRTALGAEPKLYSAPHSVPYDVSTQTAILEMM
jgi:hypothetical protein